MNKKLQSSYSNSFNNWKTHPACCEASSWRADITTKRQTSDRCSLNTASHVWQWMNYISNRMTESYGPFPLFITHESSHLFMFAAWYIRESKRVSSESMLTRCDITQIKEVFRGNNALNLSKCLALDSLIIGCINMGLRIICLQLEILQKYIKCFH